MKTFYTLLLTALSILFVNGQTPVEIIVLEGIEHHGAGDYDKAIEIYRTALELEPNSPLVYYEIAYSYFEKKDYNNAIAYTDKVLEQKGAHMQEAYMVKGSAMELIGKFDESNALFEKAIRETGAHHLLYYNLGINYFKAGDMINSEKNVLKALETNFQHTSSHLLLANIHHQLNNPIKSLLAAHFFLFLEPNTFRSEEAYGILTDAMSGNVSRDDDKPNTININFTPKEDDPFSTASLMLSLLEASKSTEKNAGKSETQLFTENTGSIFKILGELNRNSYDDIWWSEYIPFFYEIALSEHLEAYCMYIIYNFDDDAFNWLVENEGKLDALALWLDGE